MFTPSTSYGPLKVLHPVLPLTVPSSNSAVIVTPPTPDVTALLA
jgi:hypothetical protein